MRINDLIEYFGSKKAFAEAIEVSESIIYRWAGVVPKGRRATVREAMHKRADQLEKEAKAIRRAAKAGDV